jgi:hypothetical protein
MFLCGFLHFAPWIDTKGLSIFTVRLIVVISLCSILLHNLITMDLIKRLFI